MTRRLYVRIYLTTLASLAVVVLLSALLWRFTAERTIEADHDRFMGTLVGQALPAGAPPQAQATSLAALLSPPIDGLALFDRRGMRLASVGTLAGTTALPQNLQRHASPTSRVIRLDDGRVLVARLRSNALHFHLRGLAVIALIALGVALATYPIVRRLTRSLETLADNVDRFGRGELAVRASESGLDEVSSLAASFNRMADRVASLLKAHSRMLANASHELRSPLARVRLALALYETTPRPELLAGIHRDCAEIDAQIEEILLASKLDTVVTALPDERIDLAALVAEECARLDIAFDVVSAEVRGDGRLLRHLIRNLLENALKHGGEEVQADLRLGDNGERILEVRDRGPGIAESERERVFEPFYRPANAAETGSGWGLGLALVRQIADHHRGRVRCLPRAGGGCVFELTLPADA